MKWNSSPEVVPNLVRWISVVALLVSALGCGSPPGSKRELQLNEGGISFKHEQGVVPAPTTLSLPKGICACVVHYDAAAKPVEAPKELSGASSVIPFVNNTHQAIWIYACEDTTAQNPCKTPPAARASSLYDDASLAGTQGQAGGPSAALLEPSEVWLYRPFVAGGEPGQWLCARVGGAWEPALQTLSGLLDTGPTQNCPPHVQIKYWVRFDGQSFTLIDNEPIATDTLTWNGSPVALVASEQAGWHMASCALSTAPVDYAVPGENLVQIAYEPLGGPVTPLEVRYTIE
ncbi:MAG: hypothetical protein FJ299_00190 [Planctomycetes bacterium]|nr:hypothetical protein [Planctomycetota bacterium]